MIFPLLWILSGWTILSVIYYYRWKKGSNIYVYNIFLIFFGGMLLGPTLLLLIIIKITDNIADKIVIKGKK